MKIVELEMMSVVDKMEVFYTFILYFWFNLTLNISDSLLLVYSYWSLCAFTVC